MTAGERIKIFRLLNGYTQQTLADIADVSRSSVILWERGKLPTRRIALVLASLFEVSSDYLLEGIQPPTYSFWKPIPPGHPQHLKALASDLEHGMLQLFKELGINYSVKSADEVDEEKSFWIFGNSPDSPEWKLNYLLVCDKSIDSILSNAIRKSIQNNVTDLGDVHSIQGWGATVNNVAEKLGGICGHYPDCTRLYDRLGGLVSEGDDDFTLEGLFRRFGNLMLEEHEFLSSDNIETIASYLARNISERSGFTDIKTSATKLVRAARSKL